MVGTEASGARSESDEKVRWRPGRRAARGGDEDMIPVDDVGTGVGYLERSSVRIPANGALDGEVWGDSRATRFAGRGSGGEDESGSKAGSRAGTSEAGRFTPATDGTSPLDERGRGSMAVMGEWWAWTHGGGAGTDLETRRRDLVTVDGHTRWKRGG